jgi:hypothetical protein
MCEQMIVVESRKLNCNYFLDLSWSFFNIVVLGILYSDLFMCEQMIVVESRKLNRNYLLGLQISWIDVVREQIT